MLSAPQKTLSGLYTLTSCQLIFRDNKRYLPIDAHVYTLNHVTATNKLFEISIL